MAQLVIRNIEDDVKERLRLRAHRRGRSMADEVREILCNAVMSEPRNEEGAGTRMAKRFAGIGLDFEIPEMKERERRHAPVRK